MGYHHSHTKLTSTALYKLISVRCLINVAVSLADDIGGRAQVSRTLRSMVRIPLGHRYWLAYFVLVCVSRIINDGLVLHV